MRHASIRGRKRAPPPVKFHITEPALKELTKFVNKHPGCKAHWCKIYLARPAEKAASEDEHRRTPYWVAFSLHRHAHGAGGTAGRRGDARHLQSGGLNE